MKNIIANAIIPESQRRQIAGSPLRMRDILPEIPVSNNDLASILRTVIRRIEQVELFMRQTHAKTHWSHSRRAAVSDERRAINEEQIFLLELFASAFVDVYDDPRVTLPVLRSGARMLWMVDARCTFVHLVSKWRPDIPTPLIALLLGRDSSSIWHLRSRGEKRGIHEPMEKAWISELKLRGHSMIKENESQET